LIHRNQVVIDKFIHSNAATIEAVGLFASFSVSIRVFTVLD